MSSDFTQKLDSCIFRCYPLIYMLEPQQWWPECNDVMSHADIMAMFLWICWPPSRSHGALNRSDSCINWSPKTRVYVVGRALESLCLELLIFDIRHVKLVMYFVLGQWFVSHEMVAVGVSRNEGLALDFWLVNHGLLLHIQSWRSSWKRTARMRHLPWRILNLATLSKRS